MYPRAYKGISSRLIARVVIRWKCRERTRHVKVPTRKSVHVLKTWVNVQTKKKRFFGLFITSHAKLKKDDNVCHSRPYPERNSLKTKRLDVNFSKEPPDRAVQTGATQNRQNRKPSVSANCLVRYVQYLEQFHSIKSYGRSTMRENCQHRFVPTIGCSFAGEEEWTKSRKPQQLSNAAVVSNF